MAHPLINIIKQPEDEVVAAYNCIEYCFEVTDYITVNGSESFLDIQIDNPIVLGETMNIFGQQFLFTNDVNDNGHNIGIGVDEFEQRDFVYDTLLTNYEISKNFNVVKVGGDRLSLTAKKKGDAYDSDFSSTSGDIQEITNTAGVDLEVKTTYKVIGCIQVFENNEWVTKEELVRDVFLLKELDGSLKSEICFKLHGILRNLYKNDRPDLNATAPFIDVNGAFEFRFSIVDFKSTTGQVGVSGFFATGDSVCAINGRHKLEDNSIGMQPYYKNITDGFVLPLNQIPTTLDLCCNNNGFVSVFVEDKDSQGWSVEVYGNIYYKDANIEFAHRYGGFAGIGSRVVVIPIGPQQIGICNDFLNGGAVASYNYQAYVYSNASAPNLFLDGDGGTFENNISDMVTVAGLVMSQTPNGYIGNGLILEELQDAVYNVVGTTILTHVNSILFEKGKVYFLEAWINPEGFDCECISNLFLDGNYGTFDGVDPLDFINVIPGAASEVILGYDNLSLKISDLQLTTLSVGDAIVIGDTDIFLVPNSNYKLTAWVKVAGLDCLSCNAEQNIFVDGSNGTFDGGSPLVGISPLLGLTASIGVGVISNGLQLSDLDNGTILDGSRLFKGDTLMQFQSGETYVFSMDVRIENFNCSSIGNLFTDGDYGTFEDNINNISAPVVDTSISQVPQGRLGGNCVLLENGVPIVLGIHTGLINGDTSISFNAGKTYELIGWIDLEGDALINACLDSSGLELGIRFTLATIVGDFNFISRTDAVYNSSTCGSNPQWIEVKYRFSVNNTFNNSMSMAILSGPSFLEPAFQEILFDDFTIVEIGAPLQDVRFNIGLDSAIGANGTEVIDTELILDNSCSNLDTWINVQTTIQVTTDFAGKASLITSGLSPLLSNPSVIVRADNVRVVGQFDNVKLQMYAENLPSGASQSVDVPLELGADCSSLNQWTKLETSITTGVLAGNITVGLQGLRNTDCLKNEDVELMIDSIELIDTQKQNLEFYIRTSDGVNDLSTLKIDCDKLGEWHKVVGSYSPAADTNETISIAVRNRVECITHGSVRIDQIRVTCREDVSAALTPLQTVNMLNSEAECCCDDCCNEEFAYLNNLGQFDFIHFECFTEKGTIISRNTVNVCQDCDDDISTQGSKTVSASSKDVFTINARIKKEKREQLKIFAASIEIYHIVNKEYYPIELVTKELDAILKTKQYVDIDLEFVYKFENPTLIA